MKSLDARLGALEAMAPACRVCAGRSPTVIIEGTAAEIADPTYITGQLPYPRVCPSCGRRTIHLIRAYGIGNPQPRIAVADGGGL